ncbi:anoctamin-4-like [Paramacrobiotus metropolitanus]|uniref:anoctamin-4-like n=1 Tax=Paramacrobiotus metropolitanus TaxID=2943436 RepID=UPI0024464DE2|nr:anoctamin-4-like [Paramacrobiotus metropolitanus]
MVHKHYNQTATLATDEEAAVPLRNLKPRSSVQYGVTGDDDTLFFRDGQRRIDFVLVYRTGGVKAVDHKREQQRADFQEEIELQGIDFEQEVKSIPGQPPEVKLCFVKLHATWDLLTRYADIMKIRMPLKTELETFPEDTFSRYCPNLVVDRTLLPKLPHYVTTGFSKSKEALFHIVDQDTFFSPSQRSRIIWECLSRITTTSGKHHMGIQKLLGDGTFQAAYPLHDGPYEEKYKRPSNLRAILYNQWGRFARFVKFQPVTYIKNYFGERVGYYFAWMEFYTLMLIPAVIVGWICLLYGAANVKGDIPAQELCTSKDMGMTVMCPICERRCPYWRLKDKCHFAQATYLIDNPATICFATFMALWSSLFIMLWRRKQNILSWNFDTYDVLEQEEPVRPELEARFQPENWKINPITGVKEPYISPVRQFFQSVLSGTVVLFMIFLVFAATFATIVYRVTLNIAIYSATRASQDINETAGDSTTLKYSTYIVSITAAFLNLIVILILNGVYFWIAKWLTEMEYPRTQTEYDNRLTMKYYIFEFVNTYTSLFYVAFFKGRFPAAIPNNRILGDVPVDRCDKAGCLIELTIQLGVLFLGSSLANIISEILVPWCIRRYRNIQSPKLKSQWEQDHDLASFPTMGMFMEYSRMVTQFGFITMFVAAFPVAPIFALVNNLIEIRLNAYKYLTFFQRPVALWVRNIGAWGKILENVARFSVITNAFIIAFTSDFVPRLTYMLAYSTDGTLMGYNNWTLSAFNTEDFAFDSKPEFPGHDEFDPLNPPGLCWYYEFRTPPWDINSKRYAFSMTYWNVLAARVILVLVFEHFVMVVTKLISIFVPDMPRSLKIKKLRDNFVAKEAFYEAEYRKQEPMRRAATANRSKTPQTQRRTEL